jgi:hypothetical protein
MTTQDVAIRLIHLCRNGEFVRAEEELYWQNAIHIEATGEKFEGIDKLILKEKQFLDKLIEKPLVNVSDPIIAGDFFAINMHLEFIHKEKGSGIIDEILVYKVSNGKVVLLVCYY